MEEKREIKKTQSVYTLQAIKISLENLLNYVTNRIEVPSSIDKINVDVIRDYAGNLKTAADRLERNISNERLRECPFCGHTAELYSCDGGDYGKDYFTVECTFCACTMDIYGTEEEAIKTWNTRGYHD
jgi:Lar family restriction alleviation protein